MANGKQSKASAARLKGSENRNRALELRKSGASYRQIGEALSISMQRAHQLVMDELDHLAQLRLRNVDELRRLELERLEMASIPVVAKLKKGDLKAAMVWIKLSESRRKLLGLDAPLKIAPTDSDGNNLPVKNDLSKLTMDELGELAVLVAKVVQGDMG
jgi:hypothetical protein